MLFGWSFLSFNPNPFNSIQIINSIAILLCFPPAPFYHFPDLTKLIELRSRGHLHDVEVTLPPRYDLPSASASLPFIITFSNWRAFPPECIICYINSLEERVMVPILLAIFFCARTSYCGDSVLHRIMTHCGGSSPSGRCPALSLPSHISRQLNCCSFEILQMVRYQKLMLLPKDMMILAISAPLTYGYIVDALTLIGSRVSSKLKIDLNLP